MQQELSFELKGERNEREFRDTISKLIDKAYYPAILDSCKKGTSQWSWKTKEGRENDRHNVYTIIFKGFPSLVVVGDMFNQEDVTRLGFEKRDVRPFFPPDQIGIGKRN